MLILKQHKLWLNEHAIVIFNGAYHCKKTNQPIRFELVKKDVCLKPLSLESEEMEIGFTYCAVCNEGPKIENQNGIIYESQLVGV